MRPGVKRDPCLERQCSQCGKVYRPSDLGDMRRQANWLVCSLACDRVRRGRDVYVDINLGVGCVSCGVALEPYAGRGPPRQYCAPCLRKVDHTSRGARKRGAAIDRRGNPVYPIAIFNAAGWRCQLCGCDTPRELMGTKAPNAPELDHKLSIALGGEHSVDNTQLLCRTCNRRKGGHELQEIIRRRKLARQAAA